MSRKPNFFILGAPKCGTSALAAWLAENPQIFMTDPKEPEFFDSDRKKDFAPTPEQYERFFRGAGPQHRAVGEASTGYLRSQVAVPNILHYAPEAKFIVGLRHPVDMTLSWHGQAVFEGWETELDVERAWLLQESRKRGVNVPDRCPDVNNLLYGELCSLGEQVRRLCQLVGQDRILFYTMEELAEPRTLYLRILDFLGVEDDGRSEFPAVNTAKSVPSWVARAAVGVARLKLRLGLETVKFGFVTRLQNLLTRRRDVAVTPAFRRHLQDYYRSDLDILAEVTGLDLTRWLERGLPHAG